jgi:hypothetical protein
VLDIQWLKQGLKVLVVHSQMRARRAAVQISVPKIVDYAQLQGVCCKSMQ